MKHKPWLIGQGLVAIGFAITAWASRDWGARRIDEGCFEWCAIDHVAWSVTAIVMAAWWLLAWPVLRWSRWGTLWVRAGALVGAVLWAAAALVSGGGLAVYTWPALVPSALAFWPER